MGPLWWLSFWPWYRLSFLLLQISFRASSAKNRLLFRTVPACRQITIHCTVQNTMQSHYSGKARGQDTVHKQWPVNVHSTVPQTESLSYYLLSVEKNLPSVKANYPPWFPPDFQQSSDSIQGSLSLYKAAFESVFSRLNSPKSSPPELLLSTQNYFVI